MRHAGGNTGKVRLRPKQWLLIERPAGQAGPSKYFLSTLPEDTPINELVDIAHQRWRIERQVPALPEDYVPRGSPARAAPRSDVDHDTAPSTGLPADRLRCTTQSSGHLRDAVEVMANLKC